jgi:putative transport protein
MDTIIHDIVQLCRQNPSLLLFGALAGGYALAKLKFGTFSLGSTTSVLIIAIAMGATILGPTHLDLGIVKTVSFALFIFAIGYKVGPDFIGGLKRGGAKYIAVAIFFCGVALLIAVVLAKVFALNQGYSAGMIGGALTQSSVIGTADDALEHLNSGRATADMDLKSDIAVAYAVTYVFGTAGLIILLKLLTGIWRIDLPAAAKKS